MREQFYSNFDKNSKFKIYHKFPNQLFPIKEEKKKIGCSQVKRAMVEFNETCTLLRKLLIDDVRVV